MEVRNQAAMSQLAHWSSDESGRFRCPRDVTWFSAAYNWLALVMLVAAVALAEIAVVLTRVVRLVRRPAASVDARD